MAAAMTLDQAETAFREQRNNATAGRYLRTLMEYEADDKIDDDTWLDGLAPIAEYLLDGKIGDEPQNPPGWVEVDGVKLPSVATWADTPAQRPLMEQPQYIVEGIILRRLHERRIEGYTIETAKEIVEALALSSTHHNVVEDQRINKVLADEGMTVFDGGKVKWAKPEEGK